MKTMEVRIDTVEGATREPMGSVDFILPEGVEPNVFADAVRGAAIRQCIDASRQHMVAIGINPAHGNNPAPGSSIKSNATPEALPGNTLGSVPYFALGISEPFIDPMKEAQAEALMKSGNDHLPKSGDSNYSQYKQSIPSAMGQNFGLPPDMVQHPMCSHERDARRLAAIVGVQMVFSIHAQFDVLAPASQIHPSFSKPIPSAGSNSLATINVDDICRDVRALDAVMSLAEMRVPLSIGAGVMLQCGIENVANGIRAMQLSTAPGHAINPRELAIMIMRNAGKS